LSVLHVTRSQGHIRHRRGWDPERPVALVTAQQGSE